MDLEKSRNGFYTVTFINNKNICDDEILKDFNTVGNVCQFVKQFKRVFIRYKDKEEAERALMKFNPVYNASMATNKPMGRESQTNENTAERQFNQKHLNYQKTNKRPLLPTPDIPPIADQNMDIYNQSSKLFHLILANLPKSYTIKDVQALVEEAKPICINQMDATRVFNIKFCHIVLDSMENVRYLVEKLNGFVICGEKLIAAEVKDLLKWKDKCFSPYSI